MPEVSRSVSTLLCSMHHKQAANFAHFIEPRTVSADGWSHLNWISAGDDWHPMPFVRAVAQTQAKRANTIGYMLGRPRAAATPGHKMPNRSNPTISHTLDAPACGSSVFVERSQDPHRIDHQLPDATVCRNCHASVRDGRWQWLGATVGSTAILCPACRRIQDHLPAGSVSIEGDFFSKHRVELVNLVQTRANRAVAEHPLRRLMGGEDIPEGVRFTTTDTHLAREIGGALHANYGGEVNFRYADGQDLLLVHWKR